MKILNQGFDHIEFVVHKIAHRAETYRKMGFERVGVRVAPERGTRSELFAQGRIRILLTEPLNAPGREGAFDHGMEFLARHSDGIAVLAIEVDDVQAWYHRCIANGARAAAAPSLATSQHGYVRTAEIWTPEDVRYRLVERHQRVGASEREPALFLAGLIADRLVSPSPLKLQQVDHLTNNVDMQEMAVWVEWYRRVFGFGVTRHFEISTGRTGLISDVVESADRKIKVPINEATESASQVQEFVVRNRGAGVQHLALLTEDIRFTLNALREQGFMFLTVPHSYYEAVPKRVKGVTEDLDELERLGILLDGEGEGYLLQIFSQEIVGPFFFEFIQRKGNQGFGEGNFKALFETMELDQVRRGVLKA